MFLVSKNNSRIALLGFEFRWSSLPYQTQPARRGYPSIPDFNMSHTDKMKVSSFLQEDIHPRYAYTLLFACCLTSGLVDSSIYNGTFT